MSGHHAHHDPIEDNIETHPVKLGHRHRPSGPIALVIGIVLMAPLAIGFYGARSMKDEAAMSEAAGGQETRAGRQARDRPQCPQGGTCRGRSPLPPLHRAPARRPPRVMRARPPTTPCVSACHAAGVAGAPKPGDKAAWAPRLKAGKDALYASAAGWQGRDARQGWQRIAIRRRGEGRGRLPDRHGEVRLATYAIGDLQGCYEPLARLVDAIAFDPARDRLWFTGDLVNRGPDSVACLRFVKAAGQGRDHRPRQPRPAPHLRGRGSGAAAQARHAGRRPRRA
jgi:cytochrome c5